MPAPARSHRTILLFVALIMVLNATGIGLILPIMPDLLQEIMPGLNEARAATWGAGLSFTYAAMQFLMSPTLGNISDRFGRRPVLLLSLFMLAFDQLLMALAPSMALLFLARMVAGGSAATYATANAVVADISEPDQRAARFGLLGASFGMGFVLGPLIGGFLGELGPRAPFYASFILMVAAGTFGAIMLPETLAKDKRRPFEWRRANPLGTLAQVRKLPSISWFLVAFFFFQMAHFVYPAIWAYFAAERYGWASAQIGLSLFGVGLGFAVVQGGLIRKLLPILGEAKTALLGFAINATILVLVGLSTQGWQAYILLPLAALGAIATPALNGMMSRLIDAKSQGELQGATAGVTAITMMILPPSMGWIFFFFTDPAARIAYFPGAPFVVAGALMAIAIWPLMLGIKRMRAREAAAAATQVEDSEPQAVPVASE